MRIDVLCSGSKGNCTLIRSGTTSILLDCGPSSLRYIKQGLEQAGSSMQALQAMLITHTHSDHIRQLRHFAWLPVYSAVPIPLRDPKKNPVHLSLHLVTPMLPFRIGRLLITPFSLSHDAGPTLGYVIQDEQEKLVYMTDTGYVRSEILPFLRGADYYIVESNHDVDMLMQTNRPWPLKQRILADTGHLCNEDSSRVLAALITPHTKEVVLAHLSEEANTPELAMRCFEQTMQEAGLDQLPFTVRCAQQNQALHLGSLEGAGNGPSAAGESKPEDTMDGCSVRLQDPSLPEEAKAGPSVCLQASEPVPLCPSADEVLNDPTVAAPSAGPDSLSQQERTSSKEGLSIPAEMETTWDVFNGLSSTLEDEEEFVDPVF